MVSAVPQQDADAGDGGARRAEHQRPTARRGDQPGDLFARGLGPAGIARLREVLGDVEHRLLAEVER